MTKDELIKFSDDYYMIVSMCLHVMHELEHSLECDVPVYQDFEIYPEKNKFEIGYIDLYMRDYYCLDIPFDDFLGDIDSFIKDYKNKHNHEI